MEARVRKRAGPSPSSDTEANSLRNSHRFFGRTMDFQWELLWAVRAKLIAQNFQRDLLIPDREVSEERRLVGKSESLKFGDQRGCAIILIQSHRDVAIWESADS